MSKVYIVNNTSHDFSKATRFGDLVNVTEGKMPIFKTDTMNQILVAKLKDFTEEDFLLLVGPTLMCVMAYQIAVEALKRDEVLKKHSIKLLVFDAKEQNYTVRHLLV